MGKLKPTCQDNPSTLSGLHDSSCMKIPPYLLDKNIYPESVIRLWGDCPLVSCSMLLA